MNLKNYTIAQIQQTAQPVVAPPNSIDPLTASGYVLAILVSGFALLPQLFTKYVNQNLEGRQKAVEQKLDQEKGMAQVFIERTDKSAEAIESILRLSLANNFDNLRQQIEINYEYQKRIGMMEELIQNQSDRLTRIERTIEYNNATSKDILAVLKMRERTSPPEH